MIDDKKHEVFTRLLKEQEPRAIADELDVSYTGVLRLKKELSAAKLAGNLDAVMDVDRSIIEEAAASLDLDPTRATDLAKGLDGLENLNTSLQATAMQITTRVNSLILSTEHISELEACADIICALQTAFLGKPGVQLNIQNNMGGGNGTPKYNQFLSDTPGS